MLGHLRALIPGQRLAELLGQRRDRRGDGVPDGLGAMAGQRRAVVDPDPVAVSFHARQVQQHREPGGALDQGADRGAAQSEDEVALPVPRHGAVVGLGGTLADQDLWGGEVLASPTGAGLWHSQRAAGAQAGGQLAAQRPAALDIQRLVDRLV
jgi:hypothetical protein